MRCISCCVSAVLTGESSPEERRAIYDGLAAGEVDIVLTTPEFLHIHADKLAQTGRIGFVVIDEAHHIGLAKAGNRPAYNALGSVLKQYDDPVVLALTGFAGISLPAQQHLRHAVVFTNCPQYFCGGLFWYGRE